MSLNPLHTARPGTVEYRRAAHELSVLDNVFAEAPVGLAIVDEIGRFVRVNDSFARLVRTAPSDLSGKHLSILAGSADPDRARAESSAFLRGTEDLPYDCRVRTGDGVVPLVLRRRALAIEGRQYDLITATAPDDDTNLLPRSVPVATPRVEPSRVEQPRVEMARAEPPRADTDRVNAQLQAALAEVERANLAKSQFLAQMSHELRTPLNAILGFSEMLRLQMLGPIGVAKYQEYAEAIHDSGTHLLSLINDVLDVARIEAGKWEPQIEDIDVKSVVSACLRMMQVPAERGQIAMTFTAPQGPLNARADRRGLQQMILNLLSNAVKFTPKGGQVMVALSTEPGLSLITVADTGIGIAPEKLQRLGRPFEQVENPLARRHRGTGLGLALTKLIAERLGGSLGIASAEGRGTTATIRLPRQS